MEPVGDEQKAVNLLTEVICNDLPEEAPLAVRVQAASGLLIWSALASLADHVESLRREHE